MKNFTLKISLFFLFFFVLNNLSAQFVMTEYSKIASDSPNKYRHHFDKNKYKTILDKDNYKIFVQKQEHKSSKAGDVTLNIQLDFDPAVFSAPEVISVYDDNGYINYGYVQGSDPVTLEVPEGTYDIIAEFKNISTEKSYVIVKEQQNISGSANISLNPNDADNYISIKVLDENGGVLQPGTINPSTGLKTETVFDRTIFYNPSRYGVNSASFILSDSFSGDPQWNFYINELSDRYSIAHSFIGSGYEAGRYFTKFKTIKGVSGNISLENDPAEWVYHTERFRSSVLANNKMYPAFSTMTLVAGHTTGGWSAYSTKNAVNADEAFKGFLNNRIDEDPSNLLVFPSIVDYQYDFEAYLINGNPVVSDTKGNVKYGSGNLSFGWYFLNNEYYYNDNTEMEVLPFHNKFSFDNKSTPQSEQGNNVPVMITGYYGHTNSLSSQFKGRYGEVRESDFFATNGEIKRNGISILSGNYMDAGFLNYKFPPSGNFEVTFTNTNVTIEGLAGTNTTKIFFDKSKEDAVPPTLQHLQFRDMNGQVTDRFSTAAEGSVRLAAGDFTYVPGGKGYFSYNSGNVVKLFYSKHNQNNWTELPLTNYPEHFQMPAFGDYYEGTLSNVVVSEENSWFDVKVICTDAVGNKQEQLVSPAFKINEKTMSVTDLKKSIITLYPNPVKNILNFSQEVSNIKISDASGRIVKQVSYSGKTVNVSDFIKGSYIITAVNKSGETVSRKFIKE